MLKKLISLILAISTVFCLSACGTIAENINQSNPISMATQPTHTHNYSNATCNSPQKCTCGATAGTALGHQFLPATCTSPKICERCGTKSWDTVEHNYVNNTCSNCGKVDPDSLPVALNDLYIMDSKFYEYQNTFTDSFGNTHSGAHAFCRTYECHNGRGEPHSTFSLNGKYSNFSGTIVATTAPSEDATYYVKIYVDDVLAFSKTGYSKFTGEVDFNVNVENGQILRIAVGIEQRNKGAYTNEIAIVNAQLTK